MRSRIVPLLFALSALLSGICLALSTRPDPLAGPNNSWVLTVTDTDIDAAAEIVCADTGYTAMTVDTTLTFAYGTGESVGADSALIWILGIKADSTRALERFVIPTLSDTTTSEWLGLEQVWLDTVEPYSIMVYQTSASLHTTIQDSIIAGEMWSPVAHHYTAKNEWEYLEDVTFSQPSGTTGSIIWELRHYPSMADARDPTDGYIVLAKEITRVMLTDTQSGVTIPLNKALSPASYTVAWATGSSANMTGTVQLRGRRQR